MALAGLGRCGEAAVEIERALELDPLGVTVNQDAGRILYLQRRFDEAIVRLRHTLEIAPNARWARVYWALASMHVGRYEEALTAAETEPALRALARGLMGDAGAVRKELEAHQKDGRSLTWTGVLHLGLNQDQQAIESLRRAAERYEPDFIGLCPRTQPLFDRLRQDPVFKALPPH